jgi:hypothetical protein
LELREKGDFNMKKYLAILLALGALMSTVAPSAQADPGSGAASESGSAQSIGR